MWPRWAGWALHKSAGGWRYDKCAAAAQPLAAKPLTTDWEWEWRRRGEGGAVPNFSPLPMGDTIVTMNPTAGELSETLAEIADLAEDALDPNSLAKRWSQKLKN